MVGIYKITNPKGKSYIGKSKNINKRLKEYQYYLCKGQQKLYNSLIKYGYINHKVEIERECLEHELVDLESYYIDYYDTVDDGLNIRRVHLDNKSEIKIPKNYTISFRLDQYDYNIIKKLKKNNIKISSFIRDSIIEKYENDFL